METLTPYQLRTEKRKLRRVELLNKKIQLAQKIKLRKIELRDIRINLAIKNAEIEVEMQLRKAEIEVEMQFRKEVRLQKNIIIRRKIDLINANATVFKRELSRDECEDIDFVSTLYLPHGFTRIEKKLSSTRKVNWITSSTIFVKDKYEFKRMIDESLEHCKYIHEAVVYKRTHKWRNRILEKTLEKVKRDIIDTQYKKIVHHVIFSNFHHELNDDCIKKIVGFL